MKPAARALIVSDGARKFPATAGLRIIQGICILLFASTIVLINQVVITPAFAQGQQSGMHWVGTWSTPPQAQAAGPANAAPNAPSNAVSFNNQTLRMVVRTSIGGHQVRVRLSNAFGAQPLNVGAVHIALRSKGADIVPGSDRTLTFGGSKSAKIWTRTLAVSDPVNLDVPALADVAVSVYLPGEVPATFQITEHGSARSTNYISTPGDFTASTAFPVGLTEQSWYFVTGVEVMAPAQVGAVVAFGDSITDANISAPDTNSRWPNELAIRLVAAHRDMGVLNQGTGGDRILTDVEGGTNDSGLHRFDRDVLSQSGVTHVIVILGINDIRNRNGNRAEAVTADEMIEGYKQMILRAHARGIKIIGGTLLPNENETFFVGGYTPEGEAKRVAVNAWIRTSGAFDGVVDFEKALRDPSHPTRLLAKFDCGDHLHPSDLGYKEMGDAVDLALLK
jgi:lysophospholipase L1-like esterase